MNIRQRANVGGLVLLCWRPQQCVHCAVQPSPSTAEERRAPPRVAGRRPPVRAGYTWPAQLHQPAAPAAHTDATSSAETERPKDGDITYSRQKNTQNALPTEIYTERPADGDITCSRQKHTQNALTTEIYTERTANGNVHKTLYREKHTYTKLRSADRNIRRRFCRQKQQSCRQTLPTREELSNIRLSSQT